MAIANRELHLSEQKFSFTEAFGLVGTAATLQILAVPYPCRVTDIRTSAIGLSGTPVYQFFLGRFVVGLGQTSIAISSSFSPQAFGTSGMMSLSLMALGSSTLQLQANDAIFMLTTVANTAVAALQTCVVVQAIEDIKSWYGVVS